MTLFFYVCVFVYSYFLFAAVIFSLSNQLQTSPWYLLTLEGKATVFLRMFGKSSPYDLHIEYQNLRNNAVRT
jgi:hypothetical protein